MEARNVQDTLKTAAVGATGSLIGWLEVAGPIISTLGALVTLIYMIIKTYKEIK
jgi:hypothetical protein